MSTRLIRLGEAVLTGTHNLCFEQKYEKYQNYILNCQFLMVKFSIYLNRHVYVMTSANSCLTWIAGFSFFLIASLNPQYFSY